MNVRSIPTRASVLPRSAPAAPKVPVPLAPVKASTTVSLPRFDSLDAYETHVTNLVAVVRATQRDLEKTLLAYRAGQASQADVDALKKSLDAAIGQLVLLRDQYPIPSSWTRPQWLFGKGFDKAAFWREQTKDILDARFDAQRLQRKLIDAARIQDSTDDPWKSDMFVTEDLEVALSFASSSADVATVIQHAKQLFKLSNSLDKMNFAAADRGAELLRTPDEAIALAKVVKECSAQPYHSDRNITVLLSRGGELATGVPDVLRLIEALNEGFREPHRKEPALLDLARRGHSLARTAEEYLSVARAVHESGGYGEESDEVIKAALEKAISLASTPAQCTEVIELVRSALPSPLEVRDELIRKAMDRAGGL